MRRSILLITLLLIAVLAPTLCAATVTVTVIGPDGKPVPNAKVTLIASDGKKYSNTTNADGVAAVNVPENGTYLVEVSAGYIVLDSVYVSGDTSKTINVSQMHYVNLTSTPVSVNVNVTLLSCNMSAKVTTNSTVYASASINVTYPGEVVKLPFKYVLKKIVYDGKETNRTSIMLDMASNYDVDAYYTKTLAIVLPTWLLAAMIAIIIIALFAAWIAGARTARSLISEARSRRFVRKVR